MRCVLKHDIFAAQLSLNGYFYVINSKPAPMTSTGLKQVILYAAMFSRFMERAEPNTSVSVETCGVLAGHEAVCVHARVCSCVRECKYMRVRVCMRVGVCVMFVCGRCDSFTLQCSVGLWSARSLILACLWRRVVCSRATRRCVCVCGLMCAIDAILYAAVWSLYGAAERLLAVRCERMRCACMRVGVYERLM